MVNSSVRPWYIPMVSNHVECYLIDKCDVRVDIIYVRILKIIDKVARRRFRDYSRVYVYTTCTYMPFLEHDRERDDEVNGLQYWS